MSKSSPSLTTKLQNIKDYSDLILECDGQEFRVHRAIVCAQSPVLAAALRGEFVVSCTSNTAQIIVFTNRQEAKTSTVHVSFDIKTVRRLIEFM